MANWAHVKDNEILGVYDNLPQNWENYSNFFALESEEDYLKTIGWYKVVKNYPEYDSATQKLDHPRQYIENGIVYETMQVLEHVRNYIHIEVDQVLVQWNEVRKLRDQKINEFDWKYNRYDRQVRLGLPTTDNIEALDAYIQALCDVTTQSDPFNIIWPIYNP